MKLLQILILIAAFCVVPARAQQKDMLTVRIVLSTQMMHVYEGDAFMHQWAVSTARRGYQTPLGSYTPYWLDKNHRSRIYNNAPMPYSIFFLRGYAVHGTTDVAHLGQRASHGCVRLLTENARVLYALVERYGKKNTTIVIEP